MVSPNNRFERDAAKSAAPLKRSVMRKFIQLGFGLSAILFSISAHAGEIYQGVISDVHAHVKGGVALQAIIETIDQANVDRILIMRRDSARIDIGANTPLVSDQDLIDFRDRYPERVVLGFGLQVSRWYNKDKSFIEEIRKQAMSGQYSLLGEVSLRGQEGQHLDVAPSSPLFRKVLDIAADARLPVLLHHSNTVAVELESLLTTLRAKPEVTVIWAHWCGLSRPELVRTLFREFPNLHCDLAWLRKQQVQYPVMLVDNQSNFLPEWKSLIEEYPDRFLAGVDVTTQEHYAKYPDYVRRIRVALGGLSPAVARKVATGNFHRIFFSNKTGLHQ